ncbi:nitric oxide dioxygenase [Cupriavidus sp. YR651]|uniref:NO-inducible flavohemoprotein n=1 Tax=Cupriavidus sp. YR651 TaxID=1855315 RepID=UPI00088F0341|nr:NO-inducible flavohemoprotein [Cupriavidus sp. YR651]SDD95864.1 nitric oxide dioxygenase [Cupriavidus sp. YR651]
MLSDAEIAIIKATVPLLETGGEDLTRHFYRMLLNEHPEVRPLFNQSHQASSDQQRALANGVLMYARHIEELQNLGPLVNQIVNKHVSLQILPEHYPIVGACLLRAIREVLGVDIATDSVIAAWAAAYNQLAGILIQAEESAYAANASTPGGWRGARTFRVSRMVRESSEIISLYLAPEDGGKVADFEPGQYIGLRLFLEEGEVRRNYSLSALSNGSTYRISVKREPGGRVSNYLHDHIEEGSRIELFPPAGEFVLRDSDRPLALITAGVGITPALPMLDAAKASGRKIHFIHYARNGAVHAFRDWVDNLAAHHSNLRQFFCYSEPQEGDQSDGTGRPTKEQLALWLPADRNLDAYFLGPKPFMAQIKRHLRELGVPEAQTHFEFFGPASALEG